MAGPAGQPGIDIIRCYFRASARLLLCTGPTFLLALLLIWGGGPSRVLLGVLCGPFEPGGLGSARAIRLLHAMEEEEDVSRELLTLRSSLGRTESEG